MRTAKRTDSDKLWVVRQQRVEQRATSRRICRNGIARTLSDRNRIVSRCRVCDWRAGRVPVIQNRYSLAPPLCVVSRSTSKYLEIECP